MTAARADITVDPDAAQRTASDPGASVWVAASAGSGKTKVLTDRVLRLMLGGTPPQRILCLTFTKAAAAEMANRIHTGLGAWATQPEAALVQQLVDLTGETPDDETVLAARTLFARVLDVPGGLKIQTIHSFCESLLGRFPVEARVPPHFQVMDERSAAELLRSSRDSVLADIKDGSDLAAALSTVVGFLREEDFAALMGDLSSERGRLGQAIARDGGVGPLIDTVYERLGADPGTRDADIVAAACRDDAFDGDALAVAVAALSAGTEKTDQPRARVVQQWLSADPAARAAMFDTYAAQFLTQKDEPRKSLATKSVLKNAPDLADMLATEQQRLLDVVNRRRAARTAAATGALLRLGAAILGAYDRAKGARVQLDYDDLIYKARDLLRTERDGFAAWVLFKLDGGLDHILIDEAQDTNPEQWEVVAALAEEFFAGLGAREVERTVFAVGDAKQSIFSFQRADPAAFRAYRDHFGGRVEAADRAWNPVDLDISFRSTSPVLRAVDAVFQQDPARRGVVEEAAALNHVPFRRGHEGLVELWPAIGPGEEPPLVWEPPKRRHVFLAPERRLAHGSGAPHCRMDRPGIPAVARPLGARRRRHDSAAPSRRRDGRVGTRAQGRRGTGRRRRSHGPNRATCGHGPHRAGAVPAAAGGRPQPGDRIERPVHRHRRRNAVSAVLWARRNNVVATADRHGGRCARDRGGARLARPITGADRLSAAVRIVRGRPERRDGARRAKRLAAVDRTARTRRRGSGRRVYGASPRL